MPNLQSRLSIFVVPFLMLTLLLGIVSYFKYDPTGGDFRAYYAVGEKLLHGQSLYDDQEATPFKYAPIAAVYLSPFSLFSFPVGLILFRTLTVLLLALLPLIGLAWVSNAEGVSWRSIGAALFWGLLATLRFLDNEIHAVQANFIAFTLLVAGLSLWMMKQTRLRQFTGAFLFASGALFKFHPLLAGALFLTRRTLGSALVVAGAVGFAALLPWPTFWNGYLSHMSETGTHLSLFKNSIFQGLFPFLANVFPLARVSFWAALVGLGIAVPVILTIPKFSLFRQPLPASDPAGFWMAAGALLTLATTFSPLPWQHTYAVLWLFIPASFWIANRRPFERRALIALALFSGLSARGVAGPTLSRFLELNQSVYFTALGFTALFITQSVRLRRAFGNVPDNIPR